MPQAEQREESPPPGFEPPQKNKTGCDVRIALLCTLSQNGYEPQMRARKVRAGFGGVASQGAVRLAMSKTLLPVQ